MTPLDAKVARKIKSARTYGVGASIPSAYRTWLESKTTFNARVITLLLIERCCTGKWL